MRLKRIFCLILALLMVSIFTFSFASSTKKIVTDSTVSIYDTNQYDYVMTGMNGTVLYVDSISSNEYKNLLKILYPNGILDEQGQEIGGINNKEEVREKFIAANMNAYTMINNQKSKVNLEPFYINIENGSNGEYDYLFYKACVNDDVFVFPSEWRTQPFGFIPSSETNSYYVYTDRGIWSIDVNELRADKITTDIFAGKSYDEIRKDKIDNGGFLLWIDNVILSPNNEYIVYRTNRDTNDLSAMSIWKIDINDGKEEKILDAHIDNDIVGFISNENIVVGSTKNTRMINVINKNINNIAIPKLENVMVKGVCNGKLIYTSYENGSSLSTLVANDVNLNNGNITELNKFNGYITGFPVFSNDGNQFVFMCGNDTEKIAKEVTIVNLNKNEYKVLGNKEGVNVENIIWVEDEFLIKNKEEKFTLDFTAEEIKRQGDTNVSPLANGSSYSITFGGAPSLVVDFISPVISYATVNSKWNQPRNVTGSNPHNGVDLNVGVGTYVYAPYDGWVEHISINAQQTDDINFVVDANDNNVKDSADYSVRFYHMDSRISEGKVSQGDFIGKSGTKGTNAPHLHFGIYKDGKWLRNEVNYRHLETDEWNSGKDLDAYALVEWNNNKAEFSAYIMDNGTKKTFSEVRMYYRTTPTGTWIDGGVISHTNNQYSYDFSDVVPSGTTVYWMFRLTRSGITQCAFGPAKYYQPHNNPNASANPYDYWTNYVSY